MDLLLSVTIMPDQRNIPAMIPFKIYSGPWVRHRALLISACAATAAAPAAAASGSGCSPQLTGLAFHPHLLQHGCEDIHFGYLLFTLRSSSITRQWRAESSVDRNKDSAFLRRARDILSQVRVTRATTFASALPPRALRQRCTADRSSRIPCQGAISGGGGAVGVAPDHEFLSPNYGSQSLFLPCSAP